MTFFLISNAQEKWTLNDCIKYALKNNLQLKNAQLDEKLAHLNYNQSKWNLLPGVGASSSGTMNYGRQIDPHTNGIITHAFFNNSYSLSTSMDLFRGFMLQNQIRYQKYRKESVENNHLNLSDNLAFEVMNAFFDVIYYEELLKIANEQKALSELNVKKIQIQVLTGLKAQTDLLEVKANLERDELFCIQTSNNILSSWTSLKKAMNLRPDQDVSLDYHDKETITHQISTDIGSLFNSYIEWSPLISSYRNDLHASHKYLNINRAGYYPSIRLQAGYNTGYYETNRNAEDHIISFHDQIKNNQSQYIGASLSIPIFSKNSVRFDVNRAKISFDEAKTRLEQTEQTLRYKMEEDYNELTASWKELQQSERQLEADTLAFKAAQKKYDQGLINVVDFYTIKNRMANTTGQLLRSKLTLEIKKRTMDFYEGRRFWE
jgi:outer membrane protein